MKNETNKPAVGRPKKPKKDTRVTVYFSIKNSDFEKLFGEQKEKLKDFLCHAIEHLAENYLEQSGGDSDDFG